MKRLIFIIPVLVVILLSQKIEAQIDTDRQDPVKRDTLAAQLKRAQLFTSQSRFEEALNIYTGIIEREPDNRDAVQGWFMAKVRQTSTGGEGALKLIEDLEKSYPDNNAVLFWKSFIEASSGLNEEALRDNEKLIKIFPDDPLNFILRGQVLQAKGDYTESCEAFEKATSLDPSRWDVWGMKAGSLAKTGKYDEALLSINKGIELAPDQPVNFYNRACIYSLKGDKRNALIDLQKAISINPSLRQSAAKDEDFKNLYDDEDFKKLTL